MESADFEAVELCVRTKVLQVIEDSDKQPSKEQKIQKRDSSRDSFRYEADDCTTLEDDEEEGDDYDGLEGSSIWEYL